MHTKIPKRFIVKSDKLTEPPEGLISRKYDCILSCRAIIKTKLQL